VDFKDGKPVLSPSGKDTVSIIDIANPANPRIVANLPLENSIIGPPTNLAITPDNKLALGRKLCRRRQGRRHSEDRT
jgi:hypothetical protein